MCVDKGSVGEISLDCDAGIGGGRFGILNFTRLIVVSAKDGNCVVLYSVFFILLRLVVS